jgi:hypothetical protein
MLVFKLKKLKFIILLTKRTKKQGMLFWVISSLGILKKFFVNCVFFSHSLFGF